MRNLLAGPALLRAGDVFLQVPNAPGTAGTGAGGADVLVLALSAGGGTELFVFAADSALTLSEPLLTAGPAPILEARYQQGPWGTLSAFNEGLLQLDPAALALGFTFTFRLTAASLAAVSVEVTATYNG